MYISLEATNMVENHVIIEKEDVLGTANMAEKVVAAVDTITAEEEDEIINAPDEVVESDINTAKEEEELFDAQEVEAVSVR